MLQKYSSVIDKNYNNLLIFKNKYLHINFFYKNINKKLKYLIFNLINHPLSKLFCKINEEVNNLNQNLIIHNFYLYY